MAVKINIKWSREKTAFEFKDRQSLSEIRLGELRQCCHEWSRVPISGITLIYAGAMMKDDNAPLSCFGIKPNGIINMMGTRPTKTDIQTLTTNGDPEEYALIVKIQTTMDKARQLASDLLPKFQAAVQDYLRAHPPPTISPPSSTSASPDSNLSEDQGALPTTATGGRPEDPSRMSAARKQLFELHVGLSESFMQALLVFDGIECKSNHEVARATRREAVKETQAWMDQVDDLQAQVKACDRAMRR
ncbi:hypothetical protein BGW38_010073 [Lunasporangiospora selenospora]|uniref:Ubiquitin-like domain-containing protein n=1 Tax=Lunasporangiospora selenospora TaxID=979761 RepID=A0A9P6FXB9_9FUNG|nr:hypothetical protein BGW38_010073 [Lunasporangiospora selenospora]